MKYDSLSELHTALRNSFVSHKPQCRPGKIYPRFPHIALPTPRIETPLSDTFEQRLSCKKPMAHSSISLTQLSQCLHGAQMRDDGHRAHPSGGGRYPLEIYLCAFSTEGLRRSVFHYDPASHSLEELWGLPSDAVAYTYIRDVEGVCEHASALLVITSVWERTQSGYGDFGFELALIEAGHLAQNILLAAAATTMAARPLCGYKNSSLEKVCNLDTTREQVIYSITLGMHA